MSHRKWLYRQNRSFKFYVFLQVEWFPFLYGLLLLFHLIGQICSPSIIAEMLNSEVQSIKLKLNNKLAMEEGTCLLLEISGTYAESQNDIRYLIINKCYKKLLLCC